MDAGDRDAAGLLLAATPRTRSSPARKSEVRCWPRAGPQRTVIDELVQPPSTCRQPAANLAYEHMAGAIVPPACAEPTMKHYIRVCRPRFEIAVLEVDAQDFNDAECSAPEIAAGLTDEAWTLLPFDSKSYYPHVERCSPADELVMGCETEAERKQAIAEMLDPATDHSIRYLFLLAITDDGEGEVISEPWFRGDDPQLLETDISGDWISILEGIDAGDWIDYDRWTHFDAGDPQYEGEPVDSPLLERLLKGRRDRKPGGNNEQGT